MKIKENNKKNYLNQQGITLIALVITIIVLLILAAVTISTVFGENGLLKSIEIAREKTEIAEYKEDLNQKLLEAKMNVLLDNSKVLEETRKIILRDKKYDGAVVSEVKDNKFTVITKEGYKFEVTPDGVEYLEKTSGTIEGNKGSIVMTSAVEGAKANITFELKTEKTKEQWAKEWIEEVYSEEELETEIVRIINEKDNTTYENFDEYLNAIKKTRDDLKKAIAEQGMSYKEGLFKAQIELEKNGGKLYEIYFAYALDLSGIETNYNKQLEIINDTDKLKEKMAEILGCNSFEQLLKEIEITEEEFEKNVSDIMENNKLTYNQVLCALTGFEAYEPITVNVSNGDSFKVSFGYIIESTPYEYTASEKGTLTFVATGPQGMKGTIDINFTKENGDSPKEDTTLKSYEEAGKDANNNGVLTENATYTDSEEATVTIPKGFKISDVAKTEDTDGEQTVSTGLVIQDKDGNEFVWVPVNYTATGTLDDDGLDTGFKDTFKRTNDSYQEPFENGYEIDETTEKTDYIKMMKSVQKNKGFYIGRYEAGTTTPRTSSTTTTSEVVIKRDAYPYIYVGWGNAMDDITTDVTYDNQLSGKGAVYLSKHMYDNKDIGATSTLCYGVQWDAIMTFVADSTHSTSNSTSWGNYSDNKWNITRTTASFATNVSAGSWRQIDSNGKTNSMSYLLTTGASDDFKAKNIFDLAGNVYEWTMEANGSTNRVLRGGDYLSIGSSASNAPASKRGHNVPNFSNYGGFGFRLALYL